MPPPARVQLLAACLLSGTALACTPLGAAQRAPSQPILVELFTSQGCSSCPAADAFVRDLPRLGFGRDRIVPLTFHVDYWDDLGDVGWKDPFASPAFSQRQRHYAASNRLRSPDGSVGIAGSYTPQMIVAGRVHFSGRQREVARSEFLRAEAMPSVATLFAEAVVDNDRATVTAHVQTQASLEVQRTWTLNVALAMKSARTPVRRGENAGEVLEEAAIVRWLSPPLPIDVPQHILVPRPSDLAWADGELVAFVQSGDTGPVVAARVVTLRTTVRK